MADALQLQEYRTPGGAAQSLYEQKKSRFIGQLFPAADQQQVDALLAQVRKQHREARHHTYAYRLRTDHVERSSDDGEPQGTAGRPILEVLQKAQITDALLVVTRYFGGVLLGASGLLRAYSKAASLAVASADIITMCTCIDCVLTVPYNLYGVIQNMLPGYTLQISDTRFEVDVTLALTVKGSDYQRLVDEVTERTDGRVVPKKIKSHFSYL